MFLFLIWFRIVYSFLYSICFSIFYATMELSGFLSSWETQALINSRNSLYALISSYKILSEISMICSMVSSTELELFTWFEFLKGLEVQLLIYLVYFIWTYLISLWVFWFGWWLTLFTRKILFTIFLLSMVIISWILYTFTAFTVTEFIWFEIYVFGLI